MFILGWRSGERRTEKARVKKRGGKAERRGENSSGGGTTGGNNCIYVWKYWARFGFGIASGGLLWPGTCRDHRVCPAPSTARIWTSGLWPAQLWVSPKDGDFTTSPVPFELPAVTSRAESERRQQQQQQLILQVLCEMVWFHSNSVDLPALPN